MRGKYKKKKLQFGATQVEGDQDVYGQYRGVGGQAGYARGKNTVGVAKGYGPLHMENAQEGTEAVPGELPSPPTQPDLKYGPVGGLERAAKQTGEELRGMSKEDYAKLAISMLAGGEEMPLGEAGAVPAHVWNSWEVAKPGMWKVEPDMADPTGLAEGAIRRDEAGNHYQLIGSHTEGMGSDRVRHMIVRPVEPPSPKATEVAAPGTAPSEEVPKFKVLETGDLPTDPPEDLSKLSGQNWLDAYMKKLDAAGLVKPGPQELQDALDALDLPSESLKGEMDVPPYGKKPPPPEEPPFEPNVKRYARGKMAVGPRHADHAHSTDTVPAMLTPREAVLNRNAAELAGRKNIQKLNARGNKLAQEGVDLAAKGQASVPKFVASTAPVRAPHPSEPDIMRFMPTSDIRRAALHEVTFPKGMGVKGYEAGEENMKQKQKYQKGAAHVTRSATPPQAAALPGIGSTPQGAGAPAGPGISLFRALVARHRQPMRTPAPRPAGPPPMNPSLPGFQGGSSGVMPVGYGGGDTGPSYGAPQEQVQLQAPHLDLANIKKAGKDLGLTPGQTSQLGGAIKQLIGGIGGAGGVGGTGLDPATLATPYVPIQNTGVPVSGYQQGISDIGYNPMIGPGMEYHGDRGGWIGALDPNYLVPRYQGGTGNVEGGHGGRNIDRFSAGGPGAGSVTVDDINQARGGFSPPEITNPDQVPNAGNITPPEAVAHPDTYFPPNYQAAGNTPYAGTSPDPYGGTPGGYGGRFGGYRKFLSGLGNALDPNRDVSFSPRDLGYGGPMSGLGLIGEYFNPGGSNYWGGGGFGTGTQGGPSWPFVRSN